MKAEDDCKVERKHTLKLRHAMEQRPSQELLWELQQEKDLLQARVQELEVSVQVGLPAVHTRPHICRGFQLGTPDGSAAVALWASSARLLPSTTSRRVS